MSETKFLGSQDVGFCRSSLWFQEPWGQRSMGLTWIEAGFGCSLPRNSLKELSKLHGDQPVAHRRGAGTRSALPLMCLATSSWGHGLQAQAPVRGRVAAFKLLI